MKQKLKDALPLLILFGFATTCLVVLKLTGVVERIDIPATSEWVRSLGLLGAILYMVIYALRPLIFFPAAVLTLFGGYTFGAFWGTVLDVVGAGTGALLSFYIARRFGRKSVEKLLRGKTSRWLDLDERIERNGFLVILYLRLTPAPFDAINYGAGLSKIKARSFIPASYIGIIPGAFVYNYLGQSLRDVGSAQLYVAIALYLVFISTPIVIMAIQRKRKRSREQIENI
jgi:uncharacterized membrane protein YdjX (TVP38/TMEM64 family)